MSSNSIATTLPPDRMVPVAFVRLLFEYLELRKLNAATVLEVSAPDEQLGALDSYPAEQFCEMLNRASEHLDDPLFGLNLGKTLRASHLGKMGEALTSCGTVAEALLRLARYKGLLHAINNMDIRPEGENIVLEWPVNPWYYGRQFDEMGVAAIVQFMRDLVGENLPIACVEFVNPEPSSIAPYQQFFGGELLFKQPATMLHFSASLLARPLPQPDLKKVGLLDHQIAAMLDPSSMQNEVERDTRHAIARLSHNGLPSLEDVAEQLQLSPRVLSRKLGQQDLNFRALRDDTLRTLAENYIVESKLSLTDVAHRLGYAEQSVFSRAVSRWTGMSPREWRQSLLSDQD